MSAPKIVMAGGGTAGHVNPLLATALELRERGCDIVAIGCEGGIENSLVPPHDIPLVHIPKTDLPRRLNRGLFTFPFRLGKAKQILREVLKDADVVVGFGGYVSAPAYSVAAQMGIPVVIHEQNVHPGWANKMGARSAHVLAKTFSDTPLEAVKGQTLVTGLPLRPAIASLAARRSHGEGALVREEAAARLNLDPAATTLLVTGGSLGALHINQVMAQVASKLPEGVQVLHLTGKGKTSEVTHAVEQAGIQDRWHIHEYMTSIEDAFAVADLVMTRSGAGMVAELTALGLPAVYVPLPIGNGEQMKNAAEHVAAGGAILVKDADLDAEWVYSHVFPLIDGHGGGAALEQMAKNSAGLGRSNAAAELADQVMALVKENAHGA